MAEAGDSLAERQLNRDLFGSSSDEDDSPKQQQSQTQTQATSLEQQQRQQQRDDDTGEVGATAAVAAKPVHDVAQTMRDLFGDSDEDEDADAGAAAPAAAPSGSASAGVDVGLLTGGARGISGRRFSDDEQWSAESDAERAAPKTIEVAAVPTVLRDHQLVLMNMVQLPVVARKFDAAAYRPAPGVDDDPQPQLAVRWRMQGSTVESNARVVRWEDGTMSFVVGSEYYDLRSTSIPTSFLATRISDGPVQVERQLDEKWSLQIDPSSRAAMEKAAFMRRRRTENIVPSVPVEVANAKQMPLDSDRGTKFFVDTDVVAKQALLREERRKNAEQRRKNRVTQLSSDFLTEGLAPGSSTRSKKRVMPSLEDTTGRLPSDESSAGDSDDNSDGEGEDDEDDDEEGAVSRSRRRKIAGASTPSRKQTRQSSRLNVDHDPGSDNDDNEGTAAGDDSDDDGVSEYAARRRQNKNR